MSKPKPVYFAHPYHSWERALNENTNGRLRQYFPKSTNLRKVTQHEVNDAVYELNHRPRKCLQYRTPHEVFMGLEMRPYTEIQCTLLLNPRCIKPLVLTLKKPISGL